jgi:twitching motility protein PilT
VLVGVISQRLFPTFDKKGRKAATEIMVNTPAIANLIRSEKIHQIQSTMQTSRAHGMHTLEMSIRDLIDRNLIQKESAIKYLQEKMMTDD